MGTSSAWTPERRAKQAEAIRRNRPWAKSTGPRSAEGKAVSSRNADKGGHRPRHREQMRLRREVSRAVEEMLTLMRAAYAEGNLAGECIDPDYNRSESFLAALARREEASAEYWRLTWRTDDPDWRLPVEQDGYDLAALVAIAAEMDAVPEGMMNSRWYGSATGAAMPFPVGRLRVILAGWRRGLAGVLRQHGIQHLHDELLLGLGQADDRIELLFEA